MYMYFRETLVRSCRLVICFLYFRETPFVFFKAGETVPVLLMHAKHAGIHVIRATRTRNTSETTRNTNVDCTYYVLSTTQYECTWTRVLRDTTRNTSDDHVLRVVSTYYV